jgi:hypothetical protein
LDLCFDLRFSQRWQRGKAIRSFKQLGDTATLHLLSEQRL